MWPSTPPASRNSCSSRSCCARSLTAGSNIHRKVNSSQLADLSRLSSSVYGGAVQHECIPQAILGMDVVCQAKSGMGKTAVFVLAVLQQIDPKSNEVGVIVLAHTRELAVQIKSEFGRFTK